jgi:hypothetical protein
MLQTWNLELRFLWEKDDDKVLLLYKFHMLRVYNFIAMKKTNSIARKHVKTR